MNKNNYEQAYRDMNERDRREKEKDAKEQRNHFHNTKSNNHDENGYHGSNNKSGFEFKYSDFDDAFFREFIKDNGDGTFTSANKGKDGKHKDHFTGSWEDMKFEEFYKNKNRSF